MKILRANKIHKFILSWKINNPFMYILMKRGASLLDKKKMLFYTYLLIYTRTFFFDYKYKAKPFFSLWCWNKFPEIVLDYKLTSKKST